MKVNLAPLAINREISLGRDTMKNSTYSGPIRRANSLLILPFLFLLQGCGLCSNDEVGRFASPDSKLEAVVFQRDCGATTGFSTQVSIVLKGSPLPDQGGNVFVADADHGRAPSASWGGPPVNVAWSSRRTLKLGLDRKSQLPLADGPRFLCLSPTKSATLASQNQRLAVNSA